MKNTHRTKRNTITTLKLPNLINFIRSLTMQRLRSNITSIQPVQATFAYPFNQQIPLKGNVKQPLDEAWLKAKARTRTYF